MSIRSARCRCRAGKLVRGNAAEAGFNLALTNPETGEPESRCARLLAMTAG